MDNNIQSIIDFIAQYQSAPNAASGSKFDSNANVSTKNIATMEYEIPKKLLIDVNRTLLTSRIEKLYDKSTADEYIRQLTSHEIYTHDESSIKPYCVSINMYPFLRDGLTKLGGESKAPRHLKSFCGSFINLIFAVSSQFAGAVASVEFLMYFDYFAKQDYGDDYLQTHTQEIIDLFEWIAYSINQPAAARGYQSVFWNLTVYDKPYFEGMFGEFSFPDEDYTQPTWSTIEKLQSFFLTWFNKERERSLLTFPVITAAMLVDTHKGPIDTDFANMCATQLSEGNSFFIYQSESVDSLASCCRLRNEITDNIFSHSMGAGGVSTGSINVITMNINRMIQRGLDISEQVEKIHKYQIAYRSLIEDFLIGGLLPVYDAGFISLDKQYLTIGINGLVEAAEFKGLTVSDNEEYTDFVNNILDTINKANRKAAAESGYMFNTEFTPSENLGVKNAMWDKQDGLAVSRDCYNSYFYAVEDNSLSIMDKFNLHGKKYTKFLDGGSAYHCNLAEHLSADQYLKLFSYSALVGCNYFTFNVKNTVCKDCGHISKHTLTACASCHSDNITYATRIIGYLKEVDSFSQSRQHEHSLRYYSH